MPISLDTYQRLLWDASPIGETSQGAMLAGLMHASTRAFLPQPDTKLAYLDLFKWTSLLLSSLDTTLPQCLAASETYALYKVGKRTMAIIATRILNVWLNAQQSDTPMLLEEQRELIIHHLGGMIKVLATTLTEDNLTLADLYRQLLQVE